MHTAKKLETTAVQRRAHQGRTSAGRIASTTTTKGRPPPERGSSKRSQSTAITSAATPESTTVLSMRGLRDRRPLQHGDEIVAGAHGHHRDAARVQTPPRRLAPRPPPVEARGIDVDDRDPAARDRALHEPVDQRRLEP